MAKRGRFNTYKVQGMPLSEKVSAGNAFFVGNSTANSDTVTAVDDINSHGTINRPFATLDYAYNQCVANRGDTIYILEGHAETLSSSASFIPDTAGVSIIGLGHGTNRPTFTAGSTAAGTQTITFTGANNTMQNCNFVANSSAAFHDGDPLISIEAADVQIEGCEFRNTGSSAFFTTVVSIGTTARSCNNVSIANNNFRMIETSSSGTMKGVTIGNDSTEPGSVFHDGISVSGNTFVGVFNKAAIYSYSSGNLHTNIRISNNAVYSACSGPSGLCIDLNSAVTGIAFRNVLTNASATNHKATFDSGALLCVENYASNAVDEGGTIVPPAGS